MKLKLDHEEEVLNRCLNNNTFAMDSTDNYDMEASHPDIVLTCKLLAEKELEFEKLSQKMLFRHQNDVIDVEKGRRSGLEQIEEERKKILSDQVYLQECESRILEAEGYIEKMTDADKEIFNQEKVAIETERNRVIASEKEVKEREEYLLQNTEEELKSLRLNRDKDVEYLNIKKEEIRLLSDKRSETARHALRLISAKRKKVCDNIAAITTAQSLSKDELRTQLETLEDKKRNLTESRKGAKNQLVEGVEQLKQFSKHAEKSTGGKLNDVSFALTEYVIKPSVKHCSRNDPTAVIKNDCFVFRVQELRNETLNWTPSCGNSLREKRQKLNQVLMNCLGKTRVFHLALATVSRAGILELGLSVRLFVQSFTGSK